MRIVDLRTENKKSPLQVGTDRPVFSWRAETEEENWYQRAYRVCVKRDGAQVWDSGEVKSGRMNQIVYEGEPLESGTRYTWEVRVTDQRGRTTESETAVFETGLLKAEDWTGRWIGETQDEVYHLFRKGFRLKGAPLRARLHLCGLGQAECFINGERVGDAVLEPGWTDYEKTVLYNTFDVTGLLRAGANGICVKLGDGMYNVRGGRYVYFPRSYGKRKLLLQLEVTYPDGGRECVVSDGSWQMGPSPILFCCIYGGEDYDGRIPEREPSLPDFAPDAAWTAAPEAEAPSAVIRASLAPPVKVMRRYEPAGIGRMPDGAWMYDLGKNFSGRVRIRVKNDGRLTGRKIVLTPAEILSPDGEPDQRVTGRGYAWTYLCNEKESQEFAPDFTYTGFRYVKVQGADPSGLSLTGEFLYPELEETGGFSCSNALFMRIHAIIRQAMLSNIKSYFTDCPHREKLPWLEETHLIGPAMLCSWDLQGLYEKVERDMADSQTEQGLVADICPAYVTEFARWNEGFVDSPEWGSACILNPWHLYRKYGNIRALREAYPTMKRYAAYLGGRARHGILHHGLGDWLDIGPCTPCSQNTPPAVTATCIYYIDLGILAESARLFGYEEDARGYERLRAEIYEEYNAVFLDDQTGRYANGSQACQAMSLMANLVPEALKEKALSQLRADIEKRSYAITAGDVGHPYLVAALTEYGMSDLLNRMTNITETPGYGYQVVNGATTLTEEWDGPEPGRPHGSQNHLMLGSIDEWFFAGLGGIGSVRGDRSFDELRIRPHIAEGMEECSVWEAHPYGRVEVSWKRTAEGADVCLRVPPNVTAEVEAEAGWRICGLEKTVLGSGRYSYSLKREETKK